ncbi:MAG: hypothetical protein JXA20_16370 [Spirochaetes bacterium]|nr:hypothetical protein [Spirochaetota bacterium]
MRSKTITLFFAAAAVLTGSLQGDRGSAVATTGQKRDPVQEYNSYRAVVTGTAGMVGNQDAVRHASRHGLHVLNLTWEDTGRYHNSAVGPNISDMTIQVQLQDPATQAHRLFCMPVIRFPNFEDRTCDVRMDKFYVLTGNEKGERLHKVSLRDLLKNLRRYLTGPDSWKGSRRSLLARRDTHVLVSAQACFLPIPKRGDATFNPVIFNYQSYAQNPAVLTILATREGTSITVIDNQRDGFSAGRTWGQRLFFNQKGERASLTGKRLSDFIVQRTAGGGKAPTAKEQRGLNMVLLIQVPLKQREVHRAVDSLPSAQECEMAAAGSLPMRRGDVENAVIGHGTVEGPFTEIDNLAIERDERFPVRVTIQFYKATSNGVVTDRDMAEIASQINRVYADADYVGSLVVDGKTGRPTEHDGPTEEPPGWWNDFWERYERNNGQTREEAIEMFRNLLGIELRPGRM